MRENSIPHGGGATVDHKTGNIYVGDMCNHYIQYFDSEGRYVSKMGAGLLDYPRCIAIHDDKVFASHNRAGCLLVFDLVGNYITRIGGLEVTGGMLSMNYGVAIQEPYGDLYVCDWANNRVQIFLHDYPFTHQFRNGVPQSPRDIQPGLYQLILSWQNQLIF